MAIFHCYVSSPEGTPSPSKPRWAKFVQPGDLSGSLPILGDPPGGPRTQHRTAAGMHILCQKYNSLHRYAFVYIYIYLYVCVYVIPCSYSSIHLYTRVYTYMYIYSYIPIWIVSGSDSIRANMAFRNGHSRSWSQWVISSKDSKRPTLRLSQKLVTQQKKQIGYHWILDGFKMAMFFRKKLQWFLSRHQRSPACNSGSRSLADSPGKWS